MDSRYVPQLDWQTIPIELLCIIFKMLDVTSLTRCMFVSLRWNRVAQYIADRNALWKDIVTKFMVDGAASTSLRSVGFTWRDCFINDLLWNHLDKAEMLVKHVYPVPMIKNIHIFKNNLIVVHCDGITYYNIGTGNLLREVNTKCQDFEETNSIILKIGKHTHSRTLYLYGKHQSNDFDIDLSNVMKIEKVMHYRLVKNCCYVLDPKNTLIRYKFANHKWSIKHMGRYYGGDSVTVDLHVFKDNIFMMLKWGDILWANSHCGFEKTMDVQVPSTDTTSTLFIKMFQKFGIIFGVPKNKPFSFKRRDINHEKTFLIECPDLSCVAEHGELLFVGHSDGKIKIYMPRTVLEENVLRFEKQFIEIPEIANELIVAIDVFEEKGRNHLFIATHSHVAHIIFDHKDVDDYIWNEYPFKVPLKPNGSLD